MPDAAPPNPPSGPIVAPPSAAQDAALALVFLTRVPLPLTGPLADGVAARAMGWFPLVGALVGLTGGLVFAAGTLAHLPPPASALLALAATAWLTGGLHEDGAADVADGFGGGRDRARKLEIMRDSRVGSYGVLALVFSVAIRASALAALGGPGGAGIGTAVAALVAAGALSRAGLAVVARHVPPARSDGLAAAQGRPAAMTAALALALGGLVAVATLGWMAPAAILAAGGAGWLVAELARRQIGGHTGDVFGAIQQVAEAAVLLTVAAWMATPA